MAINVIVQIMLLFKYLIIYHNGMRTVEVITVDLSYTLIPSLTGCLNHWN